MNTDISSMAHMDGLRYIHKKPTSGFPLSKQYTPDHMDFGTYWFLLEPLLLVSYAVSTPPP